MAFTFSLPNEYGYVLLCAAVMGFSVILVGFIFAGRARGKIFTETYMKQNFGAEHQRVTGHEIKEGGYPDTGNGFYAKNLSYEQWYEFNNGQRAHMNYVEWIASCLVFLLIAGIYFPIPAAAVGLGIIVARFVYAIGYTSNGPTGRLIGALGNDILVLAEFVLAVISSVYFLKGDSIPN